jgi:hypothetical protein
MTAEYDEGSGYDEGIIAERVGEIKHSKHNQNPLPEKLLTFPGKCAIVHATRPEAPEIERLSVVVACCPEPGACIRATGPPQGDR